MTATATTVTPSNSYYFQNHSSTHKSCILKPNTTQWHTTTTVCRRQILVTKASSGSTGKGSKRGRTKKTGTTPDAVTENKLTKQQEEQQQQVSITLDDVNPVGLGRKSRQIFDEVWRKFSGLGQISRTTRPDDMEALDALLIREGPMCEFAIPGAQNTTVLVVGATSRIGRIVVRKLMLRGYSVKVRSFLFKNLYMLLITIRLFFSAIIHPLEN